MECFESRLNYALLPKPQRQLQKEDDLQKQLCVEQIDEYESAVSNESPSQRSCHHRRNNIRIMESRETTGQNDRLSQSE